VAAINSHHFALLAGDEDVAWIGRAVTTISLVDIGTDIFVIAPHVRAGTSRIQLNPGSAP
jgi:hypothetical protein